jgi:DNA repair protein RadC
MHEGHRKRIKQRFIKEGLENFMPHEVLELLLFYGIARKDTNEIAHKLIDEFGSFENVLKANINELLKIQGMGENAAILIHLIPQLSGYYMRNQDNKKILLKGSNDASEYVKSLFLDKKYEAFYLIHLNTRNNINFAECIQKGTIDEAAVYPRIVVESVLKYKSSKLILAHNHPGGSLEPSQADIRITRKLQEALKNIDVSVVDHFIVAGNNTLSFAERGLI